MPLLNEIIEAGVVEGARLVVPMFVAQLAVDVTGSTTELHGTLSEVRTAIVQGKELSAEGVNIGV